MTINGFNDRQNVNDSARQGRNTGDAVAAGRAGRTAGTGFVDGSLATSDTPAAAAGRGRDTTSISAGATPEDDSIAARGELKKLNARSLDNLNHVNRKIGEGEYSKPEVLRETASRLLADLVIAPAGK